MKCFASRTGTKRNLDALRAAGWGLMVSRGGVWRTEGFDLIVGDNGAWKDFQTGQPFDEEEYDRFLEWLAAQSVVPQWLVLPDIVAGGLPSLELSVRYMNRCRSVAPMVLLAVQDGMTEADIRPLIGPHVGVFLGGSTAWKLATMLQWGRLCAELGAYYHVARVNTAKRMFLAIASDADSIDGSSASRFAVTLPKLDQASRYRDLFVGR